MLTRPAPKLYLFLAEREISLRLRKLELDKVCVILDMRQLR